MKLQIIYCYLMNVLQKAIPFINVFATVPNRKTVEAIAEGERIAHDPNLPGYRDMESLRKALNS